MAPTRNFVISDSFLLDLFRESEEVLHQSCDAVSIHEYEGAIKKDTHTILFLSENKFLESAAVG